MPKALTDEWRVILNDRMVQISHELFRRDENCDTNILMDAREHLFLQAGVIDALFTELRALERAYYEKVDDDF